MTGLLKVSSQAIDAVKKTPLDSANLEAGFDKDYVKSTGLTTTKSSPLNSIIGAANTMPAEQPPSNMEVLNLLIDDITGKVTRRIARTKGTLEFKIPGSELRAYNDKMRNREWVSLYDDLYTMKEPADAEGRAERLYWMGIAKEAGGYEIKDANGKPVFAMTN